MSANEYVTPEFDVQDKLCCWGLMVVLRGHQCVWILWGSREASRDKLIILLKHSMRIHSLHVCIYRAMLAQSAVMRQSVCLSVCLSVRPSVTFRYRIQIHWNSSKITSRPN